MSEAKTYKGACLCGAVSYECSEFSSEMGHCHCSMCRQFSGAAFSTFATVPRHAFRWTSGVADIKAYLASNGTTRQFCRHCGSGLTFASPKEQHDVIELALGSLQTPLDTVFPDAHIYYDSKVNWYTPNDTLAKYPLYRDGEPL